MKNEVFLSIIMPAYKAEGYIKYSLDSLLSQSYSNWELIAVDDNSPDNTGKILDEYARTDDRITVIHSENNNGCAGSRNIALSYTNGEYIGYLDADDGLAPDAILNLKNKVEMYNSPDMVAFGTIPYTRDGFLDSGWKPIIDGEDHCFSQDEIRKNILPNHIEIIPHNNYFLEPYAWNKIFKRDFINKKMLSFDSAKKTWEDGEFTTAAIYNAESLLVTNEIYHWLRYAESEAGVDITHLGSKFYEETLFFFIDEYEKYEKLYGAGFNCKNQYRIRFYFKTLNFVLLEVLKNYDREKAEALFKKLVNNKNYKEIVSLLEKPSVFELKLKWKIKNPTKVMDLYEKNYALNFNLNVKI